MFSVLCCLLIHLVRVIRSEKQVLRITSYFISHATEKHIVLPPQRRYPSRLHTKQAADEKAEAERIAAEKAAAEQKEAKHYNIKDCSVCLKSQINMYVLVFLGLPITRGSRNVNDLFM